MKNDFLFVFAGTEMPTQFLMSLGIQIDTLHGKSLGPTLLKRITKFQVEDPQITILPLFQAESTSRFMILQKKI